MIIATRFTGLGRKGLKQLEFKIMKCVDKEGHDWSFVGYVVVADNLEKQPVQPPTPNTTPLPSFRVPKLFPAKIEAWQCRKCGQIDLKPAVFTRIMQGDKESD